MVHIISQPMNKKPNTFDLFPKLSLKSILTALMGSFFMLSCSSTEPFTGYSYDPPDATDTRDKQTDIQKKRIIGFGTPKIWVSNEFNAARLNDAWLMKGKEDAMDTVVVLIEPENAPINNSPWYGFKIWSDESQSIILRLEYTDARHRYVPKWTFSPKDLIWQAMDSVTVIEGDAMMLVSLGPEAKWIAAHPTHPNDYTGLKNYLVDAGISELVQTDTVGYTHANRGIIEWKTQQTVASKLQQTPSENMDEPEQKALNGQGLLLLFSRQHPPEVTGYRTFLHFYNRLHASDDLAIQFRELFTILAYPMLNPDGVVEGHWRHNLKGIDLNRDWEYFRQPETRAVRDAVSPYADLEYSVVYGIDFHSTNENVFYPINEEVVTGIDNFTQRWFPFVAEANPALNFRSEEFEPNSPISKNWVYKTFGTDALTFEVNDTLSEEAMKQLGITAAESLMKLLLEELDNQTSTP